MKTLKTAWSFFLILCMCFLLVATTGAQVKQAPPGAKLNILSCPDLSGRARAVGIPCNDGLRAWFDYLNKEKGGIDGVPVNLIVADGKYDVTLIQSIYKRYLDNVLVMFFPAQSVAFDSLLNNFKTDKMPAIETGGGPDAYVYPPGWVYATKAGSADKCGLFVQWIMKNWKENRKPRLALLLGNYPAGRFPEKGIPYYKNLGVDIVAVDYVPFQPLSTVDQLMKIRDAKADFIYDTLTPDMLRIALGDAPRIGWKLGENITWASFHTYGIILTKILPKEQYDGLIGFEDSLDWYAQDNWRVKKLTQYYQEFYKTSEPLTQVGFMTAAAGMMVEEALRLAMRKVGYANLTPEVVREEGLCKIKNFETDGFTTPMTITKDTPTNRGARMVQLHKDKLPTVLLPFTQAPWVFKWVDEHK